MSTATGQRPDRPRPQAVPLPRPCRTSPMWRWPTSCASRDCHPSYLPLGLIDPGRAGGCVLCNTCNSFPCQVRGKADADTVCVTPRSRPTTSTCGPAARSSGWSPTAVGARVVTGVRRTPRRRAGPRRARATVVLVGGCRQLGRAAPAQRHRPTTPTGLAQQLGPGRAPLHGAPRHDDGGLPPVPGEPDGLPEDGRDQRLLPRRTGTGSPLGHLQSQGRAHAPIIRPVVPCAPDSLAQAWVRPRCRLAGDDRGPARPDNRVTAHPGGPDPARLPWQQHGAHAELVREATCDAALASGYWAVVRHVFKDENTTHQCGTAVFGEDPRTSVLDPFCRTHDAREPLRRRRLVLPLLGRGQPRPDRSSRSHCASPTTSRPATVLRSRPTPSRETSDEGTSRSATSRSPSPTSTGPCRSTATSSVPPRRREPRPRPRETAALLRRRRPRRPG